MSIATESSGQSPSMLTAPNAAELPTHVRRTSCLDGLSKPFGRGINLAIWEREIPGFRDDEIQELMERGFDPIRIKTDPGAIGADLRMRLPDCAAGAWLPTDAAALAVVLAAHSGTRHLSARLEIVTGDSCRFFHADSVPVRLLTTYAGRGTQWLDNEDTRSVAPGAVVAPELVKEIGTGDVALLRGSAAAGNTAPLMHRSPPRRQGDPARLVLAIDPDRTRT